MADVVVLLPVLGRPERVAPLLESLYGSERERSLRSLFLLTPGDEDELVAVMESDSDYLVMGEAGSGEYAKKINAGIRHSDEPWIFMGADDLCFCPGWADVAIACSEATGRLVVGTDDLGNPTVRRGRHATHSLIHRDYVLHGGADGPDVLHEGYRHNWVDSEFCELAKARNQFVFCPQAQVEHLHPFWHKAQDDSTYALGRDHYAQDRLLFMERQRLWANPSIGG